MKASVSLTRFEPRSRKRREQCKNGVVVEFLGSVDRIAEAVLAVRDALAVVRARGIDVDAQPDTQMFAAPEQIVA